MFSKLKALLTKKPRAPIMPFIDRGLGEFEFDDDLGWKKRVDFGDVEAELVIGSDGELPSDEMIETARMWTEKWCSEKPRILGYVRKELRDGDWTFEPDLPNPDRFVLQSINVLWADEPKLSMIYLEYPGDEIRCWHVTCDGTTPQGFAYDD